MSPGKRRHRMRELLSRGVAPREIAAQLGVAASTVYRARARMGLQPQEAAAYAVVSTRLTQAELAVLDRMVAAKAAKSRHAALRKLVRAASDMYEPSPSEEAFLLDAERHLSRLGGNFNQIAAALSASMRKIGRAEPGAEQVAMMRGAADQVVEIREVLAGMLRKSQARVVALEAALREAEGNGRAVREASDG